METALQRIVLLTAVAIAAPTVGFGLESTTHVWTFNDDAPKTLPAAFQVGTLFDGRPGRALDQIRCRHLFRRPETPDYALSKRG